MNAQTKQVETRFSAESENWDDLYSHTPDRSIYVHNLHRRRDHALSLLDGETGTVLDLGCGAGNVTIGIEQANRHVVGADVSLPMLQRAKQSARATSTRLALFATEGNAIGVRNESLSTILCLGVIEYADCVPEFLQECRRVLKPGGTLIISHPNRSSLFVRLDDACRGIKNGITRRIPSGIRRWTKHKMFNREDRSYFGHRRRRFESSEFRRALENAGFEVLASRVDVFVNPGIQYAEVVVEEPNKQKEFEQS